MPSSRSKLKITPAAAPAARPPAIGTIVPGQVAALRPDGLIDVQATDGSTVSCAWLESGVNVGVALAPGDTVLYVQPAENAPPVVLGRVGRFGQPAAAVTIEAGQTLSLKCGASAVDLRADGKVMIRGDDVLVRAKGTQRIRAGSVSIN